MLTFIGCIPVIPPPTNMIDTLEMTINRAKQNEVDILAPLEFTQATQKLEQAKIAMKRQEYETAIRLVEKGLMDIKVAEAKTASEKTKKKVLELQESLELLRKEIRQK